MRWLLTFTVLVASTIGCNTLRVTELEPQLGSVDPPLSLVLEIDRPSLLVALGTATYRLIAHEGDSTGLPSVDRTVSIARQLEGRPTAEIAEGVDDLLYLWWFRESALVSIEQRASGSVILERRSNVPLLARDLVGDSREDLPKSVVFRRNWRGETTNGNSYAVQRELEFRENPAAANLDWLLRSQLDPFLGGTESRGKLRVSFAERKTHWAHRGMIIPSVLTLFLINALGAPVASQTCEVELMLEVVSASGELLGEYAGAAEVTDYAAAYWGYSFAGAGVAHNEFPLAEAVATHAALAALESAAEQLRGDANRIRNLLNATP